MISIRRLLSVSLAASSLVACMMVVPSASAQTAAPPPPGAPAPAPAEPTRGPRTHDGFYLRLGGGYGYASTSTDPDTKLKGGGGAFGLSIGGSPIPGLAIAGTMFLQLQKTSVTVNGNDFPNPDNTNFFYLGIGPLVDFYPDPKAGLHFGGTIHYATWNRTNLTAGGYGLGIHGGYDFFFSDSWSVGPTLQLLYANTDKDNVKFSTTSISAMITLVDH